jgi:DNA-binding transcriptional regulator WhiA
VTSTDILSPANRERSQEAAHRNAETASRILREGPGPGWPTAYVAVVQARSQYPDDTWAQLGQRLGMSKDAVASMFRRACEQAVKRGVSLAQNGPAPLP